MDPIQVNIDTSSECNINDLIVQILKDQMLPNELRNIDTSQIKIYKSNDEDAESLRPDLIVSSILTQSNVAADTTAVAGTTPANPLYMKIIDDENSDISSKGNLKNLLRDNRFVSPAMKPKVVWTEWTEAISDLCNRFQVDPVQFLGAGSYG